MKSLARFLTIGAILTLPLLGLRAQEKEAFVPKTYIAGGIGFYRDSHEGFRERYGSIVGYKLKALRDFSKDFRGEVEVSLFSKSEKAYAGGGPAQSPDDPPLFATPARSLSLLSIAGNFHYVAEPGANKDWTIFLQAGLTFTQAREEVDSRSESGQGVGILVGGGVEVKISEGFFIYGDVLYRSVSTERLDLSGTEFGIGLRQTL